MDILSGNLKVLNTGSVLQFNGQPLDFIVKEKDVIDTEEITMRITFSEQESDNIMEQIFHNEKFGEIILLNLRTKAVATKAPIPVGTLNNKILYFVFVADKSHELAPIEFSYTWYVEEMRGDDNASK